jgi:hypothetical protein
MSLTSCDVNKRKSILHLHFATCLCSAKENSFEVLMMFFLHVMSVSISRSLQT